METRAKPETEILDSASETPEVIPAENKKTRTNGAASVKPSTSPRLCLQPELYRIDRARRDCFETRTLKLVPAEGQPLMTFRPGQFNMLYVFGKGEVPISISGATTNREHLVHTIRGLGAVTQALVNMKKGETIGVRGPFGNSWPLKEMEGHDVVFVAGGIGLAPLRPAILHVLENRRRYGNVVILYGARRPAEILYDAELTRWGSRFDVDVHVTVDQANAEWFGSVGVVTKFIRRARFDPNETVAVMCGPEVMMRYTVRLMTQAGVAPECQYLSMERNMQCAVGWCGHCQFGKYLVCRDGPVFRADALSSLMAVREM